MKFNQIQKCTLQENALANISAISFICYRKTSSISRAKSQNLNVSCILLQLSLLNPLKPGVKLRMKMQLEQRWQAMLQLHLSYQQFYCLLRCDLYKRFYGSVLTHCGLETPYGIMINIIRSNSLLPHNIKPFPESILNYQLSGRVFLWYPHGDDFTRT